MRDECGHVLAKSVGEKERGAVWSQHLRDLMHEPLCHREGTIPDVNRQDELADRVHRDPYPVWCTRQTLDGQSLGDLALFDRTEQGEEFIHLHLCDVEIMQVIARKGLHVLGRFNQPAQYRIGITLEDAGDRANAKALSQRRNGPHQLVRVNLLAVKGRAMGFQEMPVAAETRAYLRVRGQGQAEQGLKASIDPGESEV